MLIQYMVTDDGYESDYYLTFPDLPLLRWEWFNNNSHQGIGRNGFQPSGSQLGLGMCYGFNYSILTVIDILHFNFLITKISIFFIIYKEFKYLHMMNQGAQMLLKREENS